MQIVAYILLAVGVACALGNAAIAFNYCVLGKHRDRSVSLIPIIGGACVSLGMWMSGVAVLERFAWVALLADIGCVPLLVASIVAWIRRR